MVWGMSLPGGIGPYGPDGEYEGEVDRYGSGWMHRLRAYFREQMPEEQRAIFEDGQGGGAHRYSFVVWGKLKHECGTRAGPDRPAFTPIEDHEPPRFFKTAKGYGSLASVISLPGQVWAVDKPTKATIERMEAGIHQFFPIEIRMPRGKVYPTPYMSLLSDSFSTASRRSTARKGRSAATAPNIRTSITTTIRKRASPGWPFQRPNLAALICGKSGV